MKILLLASMYPSPPEPENGTFNRQRAAMFREECGLDVAVLRPHLLIPPEAVFEGMDGGALAKWVAGRRAIPSRYVVDGTSVVSRGWIQPPRRWLWHLWGDWLYRQLRPRIPCFIGPQSPSLVLASRLVPEGIAAARLARDLGIPSVVIAEGSDVLVDLVQKRQSSRLADRLSREPSAVVYVSRALRDAAHGLGLRHARERVVHNSVDFGRFTLAPVRERGARRRIVTIGPLYPVKGHDILLRSVRAVRSAIPVDVELELVGSGPERQHLESLASELGLSRHVTFAGPVDHHTIPHHIAHADVVCMPSRSEGFGVAAAEALACGRPVVAFDAGGLREIVHDGANGFLVAERDPISLADALIKALDREWNGKTIRADAEARFSMTVVARQWSQLFADVVSAPFGRRSGAGRNLTP